MQWRGQGGGYEVAVILSPINTGLIPGNPGTATCVSCDIGVSLEFRAGSQRLLGAELAILEAAKRDIVVSFVVSVPDDVSGAVGSGGDRRLPVVSGRIADAHLVRPAAVKNAK